jgi:hypothetical protein
MQLQRTALHEAAAIGDVAFVRAALAAGAAIDAIDADGWSPLMEACDFGHIEVATQLLDAGADSSFVDPRGVDAFTLAFRGRHDAICELFKARSIATTPHDRAAGSLPSDDEESEAPEATPSEAVRKQRMVVRLEYVLRRRFEPLLASSDGATSDTRGGGAPSSARPRCKECKQEMRLLLQLDAATLPSGSPLSGRAPLQLFSCGARCADGDTVHSPGGKGVVVRLLKRATPSDGASVSEATVRIVGWKEGFDFPPASEADYRLDAKELRLLRAQKGAAGDKLGGRAHWLGTPRAPTCPTCETEMSFIFQLTPRLVGLGASALAYLHQCSMHPTRLAFSSSSPRGPAPKAPRTRQSRRPR